MLIAKQLKFSETGISNYVVERGNYNQTINPATKYHLLRASRKFHVKASLVINGYSIDKSYTNKGL